MKAALAQINATVGDLAGNARLLADAARDAYHQGATLVLAPELALAGYPPEDLLLRPAFMQACADTLAVLAGELADCPGLHLVVGHPHQFGSRGDVRSKSHAVQQRFNAASVLSGGHIVGTYCKRELPNYQVFDERRYFASGRDAGLPPLVVDVGGLRIGLLICEDAWFDEPAQAAVAAGAELLCVLNASPFHLDKADEREARMAERARAVGRPLLYAHLVGGQDEVVFDGASFALDATGQVTARAVAFEPALLMLDIGADHTPRGDIAAVPELEAQAWTALVTGVRDYLGKNGFPGAIIGLSGGIDSALVLAIAVDALGADKVRAVMMPSPNTADISWIDARDMAARLGVRYDEIAIDPMFQAFRTALSAQFEGRAEDTTEENLQARIRGMLLMALS
ncbi:MAG: NAD(+) synthase, partial [Rubrivivax sp.]|nr:NAD(+) synthase [Rubrivivax sp.]